MDLVDLPAGRPALAVRRWGAEPARAEPVRAGRFLLVHGLASNARLWDGVARRLADAGHAVVAVDQRGHGLSPAPDSGYDTVTCADDLAALIAVLGWVGPAAPVVVGQSWGGNVVLTLAATHPGKVRAVACVDGGWIRLRDRFSTFEDCWAALEPPRFDGLTFAGLAARIRAGHPDWPAEGIEGTLANLVALPDGGVRARLAREHHRSIVQSLFEGDPAQLYPRIDVPVLLIPAGSANPAVDEALAALPRASVRWYPGADHDIHAQHPDQLAKDLEELA